MAQNKVSCMDIVFGDQKIPFIGGPCVIESRDHSLKMAEEILKITDKLDIPFIFKSSFDKANRTSINSFRGNGLDEGLKILEEVKDTFDFVVTRAVASFGQIREWVNGKISTQNKSNMPNGIICLKGGDLTEELKKYKKRVEVYDLSDLFEEEFFETKKIVYWAV